MLAWILLAAGSAIVFYILIAYPALLAFSCRREAPPVRKDPAFRPKVSVLLAVHNGRPFIRKKLECLLALNYPRELLDILVVSDGSSDATEPIVEAFAQRGVRLLRVPRGGKAAALNAGLKHVSGEILFFTDVRQDLPADSLVELVANFADPSVGAVTGEPRFLNPDRAGEQADMELYWRYELWVRRRHSRIASACNTTGWIYALRRSLATPIPVDTLTDDGVIPLKTICRGYRVVVEPKALAFDSPRIKGGEFRRKLRTLGGLWQVHVRMPELFTSTNAMRFHFLSHKSARLLLPWAILMTWLPAFLLPASPFQRSLAFDPLFLLALAALDPLVPKGVFFKRISSPVRSFLIMNLAALLAPVVFIVPAGILWRPTVVADAPALSGAVKNEAGVLKMQP
ncbi:MAG TPA: glycosyltransferase family 2 protein [Bryobacteraceae bacterium]|nr:glycosyltransferase family 2 protein [Bryobacteraceae bacterium]